MTPSLVAVAFVVAGWSILARGLQRWRLTAPLILVLAGMAVGFTTMNSLAPALNTQVAQRVAELVMAVLLFVDATDVRGGFFGRDPRSAARLLFVALPTSVGAAVLIGWWLLPNLSFAVLTVIACAVVPIDFGSSPLILRDERLPGSVRNLLKVEAGYNDGIISAVFVCALAVAAGETHQQTIRKALTMAVPPVIEALAVGAALGAGLALLANAAERHDLMTDQSKRLLIMVAPILSFSVSVGIGGNGFVSAFVCGIAMNALRRSETFREQLMSADDLGFLLAAVMWFVFGCAAVLALQHGVSWRGLLFALCAVTVVRLVPVLLSTLGSRLPNRDRLAIGCLGPRGTPSIIFGLIAYNVLDDGAADATLVTMVLVILVSIAIHGMGSPVLARMYSRAESQKH